MDEMKRVKRILCLLLAGVLMMTPALQLQATETVTPSKKEYNVLFGKSNAVFLSNEKAVSLSKGEAVFLAYTVEYVEEDTSGMNGVIASANRKAEYPYDKDGVMEFRRESVLMKEGYTYFYKIEATEYGFDYVVAYSNGIEEDYITFNETIGEVKDNLAYGGAWFTGSITAKLSHVRCYDEDGNDLGVAVTPGKGAVVFEDEEMQSNQAINHRYEFELKDAYGVAISNREATKADVIYMEYTVQTTENRLLQTGIEMTNSPRATIPHDGGNGYLYYENITDDLGSKLAISGATYLIRFERAEQGFDTIIQYTLNGKVNYISFKDKAGTYDPTYEYFTLWFGGSAERNLTAKFTDFRCYDEKGNNLAVQLNKTDVAVTHIGGLEDYSICQGMYYCLENDTFIVLDEEQTGSMQVDGQQAHAIDRYVVENNTLTLKMGGKTKEYEYWYLFIKDDVGNKYVLLKDCVATFITGTEEYTQNINADNYFKVVEPKAPVLKGNTFLSWCLGDGTEYDFDSVAMESVTLYAKWRDGHGNEYLATEYQADAGAKSLDVIPVISVLICVLLVLSTIAGVVLILKKRKKPYAE